MGQIITAASGGNPQNKKLEFAGLFEMTGSSGEKIKAADSQPGKNEEDINNLVPFLQFLNQQMSKTDRYSDDDSAKQNNNDITMEQAMSLLQSNVTLQELKQALINMAASGETNGTDEKQNSKTETPINDLLREINLLNEKADTKDLNSFLAAAFPLNDIEENILNENNAIDVSSFSTDKELKERSFFNKNDVVTIDDQDHVFQKSGVMPLETVDRSFFQENESLEEVQIEMTEAELKNAAGNNSGETKTDNISFQSELEKKVAENEIKFNKEKESALKNSGITAQQQKMNNSQNPDALPETIPGRIIVESNEVKDESGKNDNLSILPVESEDNNSIDGNNLRSTTPEIKESQIAVKDSLRSGKPQHPDIMNSTADNKSLIDQAKAFTGELSGYIKAGQKAKTIPSENGKEEILLSSINVPGNSAGIEKNNEVSADRLIGQITHEIKETAANDGGRVKIALNPPSLGKLEMDVTVRNGKVEVVLVADNKEVQQALNMHIDKLKGGLQNQGLTIDRCDVFMQENRDEYRQNFGRQAFYQDGGSRQNDDSRQDKSEEKITSGPMISLKHDITSRIPVSIDNISLFA